jgi:hypothetical protein
VAVPILEQSFEVLDPFAEFGEQLSFDLIVLRLFPAYLLIDVSDFGRDEFDLVPGFVEEHVVVGVVLLDSEEFESEQCY